MTEANVTTTSSGPASVPGDWKPHIVALVCNWCSYAGADMAGTTRLEYPANVRMVRFPCTGRMSPLMILRAFEQGADGVLVSGCHPGDCHYVQGNLVARRRFTIFRSLMDFIGIDLKRLHFAWVSAAEGHKWAKVVNEVTAAVQEAGPLPKYEFPEGWDGIDLPDMAGTGPQELNDKQLGAIRANLQKATTEALSRNNVGVVIGFGAGTLENQTIPVHITDPSDCDKLVWNQGIRNNLSTYISLALEKHERVAVVVKTCDLGALSGLIREGQLRRDQLLVIGVQCPGILDGVGLATKCFSCSGDPHPICDLVVTTDGVHESCQDPSAAALDTPDARDEQIAHLESLPHDERWKYWQRQFSRCLRCYACRAACPLCYCSTCISDKHRPQWVPTSIDNVGNSSWNIIRALHLAGRCSGCDECARVCPADIRLDLINRKLALEVERQYGKISLDPEEKSALVDFRMEDSEEFIL
jgi:coenzyme F420-reducing hydrogenase delta subunit/ferredoxin